MMVFSYNQGDFLDIKLTGQFRIRLTEPCSACTEDVYIGKHRGVILKLFHDGMLPVHCQTIIQTNTGIGSTEDLEISVKFKSQYDDLHWKKRIQNVKPVSVC